MWFVKLFIENSVNYFILKGSSIGPYQYFLKRLTDEAATTIYNI